MNKYKPAFFLALTFGLSLFGQGIKITTEPTKKALPIEEGDKTLAAGGAFGDVIFDHLTSNGLLKLNGTTVKEMLQVNGTLLTQGAQLNDVEVFGEANLKNSTVANALRVVGTLRAEKSNLKGPLTLTGVKATFIGSQIESIHVVKEPSCKGHQIIELKQKTMVNGPIVFDAGKGEVHCYPGSYVFSPITGGKLIKKN
jgi:hypothetical protein